MKFSVYVISLPSSADRRSLIARRLHAIGRSFSFVDAIDGRSKDVEVPTGKQLRRECFASETAIACTLSHLLALERMLFENSDAALVVEDDAFFDDDFAQTLEAAISVDCEIIRFEGTPPKYFLTRRWIGNRAFVTSLQNTPGAACYLIKRTAAQAIVSLPVLDGPIDEMLDDWRLGLKVIDVVPRIAHQDRESLQSLNLATRRPKKANRWLTQVTGWHLAMLRNYGPRDVFMLLLQRLGSNLGIRKQFDLS